MSMHPPPYGAPWPPPPPTGLSVRARVGLAMAAAVALVGASAAAGAVVFDDGPIYPQRWDPRVADIARFVEQERGHPFRHPVRVYFLSPERYREIAGGGPDQAQPTPEEREYSENTVAEYRALGLMEGAPDLLAANETIQDSGTLAFYSPDDDVVNVRGTDITPAIRVTLAHELTHALQDQYFDLSPIGDAETADESGAARAVVEGDAVSVEDAYVAAMSDEDRAQYETESSADSDAADTDLGDVPAVLQVLFGSYYAVGNAFVEFWQADPSGEVERDNIDQVLRRLPDGSHQLFDPATYIDFAETEAVDPPADGFSNDEFERSTHGVDLLFVMLAERIDPLTALRATDGWTGDSYVAAVGDNDKMCVSSRVAFAAANDVTEFRSALDEWSKTMPTEAEVAIRNDDEPLQVTFTSCDPGPLAKMNLTDQAGPALAFPVTRLRAAADAVTNGRSRESGLCYGQAVIERLTLADLQSDERTPKIATALEEASAACP